jgi:type IV pilus assembly protein PilX
MVNLKRSKNSGVVLVTALIMVFAVTGIAVSLMSSSSIDLKVVSAIQEKEKAINLVKGDSFRAISVEKKKVLENHFYYLKGRFEAKDPNNKKNQYFDISNISGNTNAHGQADSKVLLFNENNGPGPLACLPRLAVTPSLKCNYLRMQTSIHYGKLDSNNIGKHDIEIHNGMVQALGPSTESL